MSMTASCGIFSPSNLSAFILSVLRILWQPFSHRKFSLSSRAAVKAIKLLKEDIKDYTFGHAERLYALQFAQNGKKFEFLKLVAFAEDDKIVICRADMLDLRHSAPVPFNGFGNNYFKNCSSSAASREKR